MTNKTNIIFFRSFNKIIPRLSHITINDLQLYVTNKVTYLGIVFDVFLTFKEHIQGITSKVSKLSGIIRKLSFTLPNMFMKQLYYAYIHPCLTYGNMIWASTAQTHLEDLQIVQNRILKFLFHIPFLTNTLEVFQIANIQCIKKIYYSQLGMFVYNVINDNISHNIEFSNYSHVYSTRSNNNLKVKFSRTVRGSRDIMCSGPEFSNSLAFDSKYLNHFKKFEKD
jgi:hypothetical protein